MGAPKQKWTPEEEAALRAGVVKHGAGKWRTILKDPEFSGVLYLRSNVDLKDKWRNMSVMANGWGSRDKARLAVKKTPPVVKQEEAVNTVVPSDEEMVDAKSVGGYGSAPLQIAPAPAPAPAPASVPVPVPAPVPAPTPRRPNVRLDSLIMEAISTLKEPGGSNKTNIASYIEEHYWAPPDFKRLLSAKLKYLTANSKLIKVKRKYRIAPTLPFSEKRRNSILQLDRRDRMATRVDRDDLDDFQRAQIDLELARMRTMTPKEAAAAAARAVAEAEAAIAEAEAAEKEAKAAEADAEAAQAFAEAAMKTLKAKPNSKMGNVPNVRA